VDGGAESTEAVGGEIRGSKLGARHRLGYTKGVARGRSDRVAAMLCRLNGSNRAEQCNSAWMAVSRYAGDESCRRDPG